MLALPDFRLFWTAYDPLDLAGGSIDVLGLQAGYLALADKFLPGFTTVTTAPRYVSMLCAAVGAVEEAVPCTGEPSARARTTRLAGVKSYERAWALACALAATDGAVGTAAVDGLRGIQSVRRRLGELAAREKSIRTASFNMLADQVRYGGIGAYASLVEECHLASMRSLALRPPGARLAGTFPGPGDLSVWDEEKPLSLDALKEWGLRCHLGAFKLKEEGTALAAALRGGEEGGRDDEVRWTTLRLLSTLGDREAAEPALLDELLESIRRGDFDHLKVSADCLLQIEAALVLIHPYELFSQAVQFLFDAVRAAATDEPEVKLDSVATTAPCVAACKAARKAASDLLDAIPKADGVHQSTQDVRRVLTDTGVGALAEAIRATSSDVDLLDLVLTRHRDVQQGKFDRGQRKAPWVARDAGGPVRLTAQRHQLQRSDRCASWDRFPRHPYRTWGARQFARACGIR